MPAWVRLDNGCIVCRPPRGEPERVRVSSVPFLRVILTIFPDGFIESDHLLPTKGLRACRIILMSVFNSLPLVIGDIVNAGP